MNFSLKKLKKQFTYYQQLGEKTFAQLPEESLFWQANEESNSIALLVQHLSGNMLSRWTDFLTTDGEKEWRKREEEFRPKLTTKTQVIEQWNKGWNCLHKALESMSDVDLEKEIFIRNMGHTVIEAIHRQLAHYAYHIGQIVFIGKLIRNEQWETLSIPKGASEDYNKEKFSKPRRTEHFTDDL